MEANKVNKGSLVLMSLKLSSDSSKGVWSILRKLSQKISSQLPKLCGSRNIHTPPPRELEIPRRPRKFQREMGLDDKNDFPRGLNSNSVRNLLLTDLVDHFWSFYGVISMVYKSVDHGKLWSIFRITFIFLRKTKNKTTGSAWHVTSFPWSILS